MQLNIEFPLSAHEIRMQVVNEIINCEFIVKHRFCPMCIDNNKCTLIKKINKLPIPNNF